MKSLHFCVLVPGMLRLNLVFSIRSTDTYTGFENQSSAIYWWHQRSPLKAEAIDA